MGWAGQDEPGTLTFMRSYLSSTSCSHEMNWRALKRSRTDLFSSPCPGGSRQHELNSGPKSSVWGPGLFPGYLDTLPAQPPVDRLPGEGTAPCTGRNYDLGAPMPSCMARPGLMTKCERSLSHVP